MPCLRTKQYLSSTVIRRKRAERIFKSVISVASHVIEGTPWTSKHFKVSVQGAVGVQFKGLNPMNLGLLGGLYPLTHAIPPVDHGKKGRFQLFGTDTPCSFPSLTFLGYITGLFTGVHHDNFFLF